LSVSTGEAGAIRARDASAPASPVLTLNASGMLPPLHGLPGAGADAFALHALARALGPDQPVHALQWPGLCGHRQPESVEALAAWFVEQLLGQPEPERYVLLGSSFGGVVAYEMARQLQAAGRRVALLVLVAANRPGHPVLRSDLRPWTRLSLSLARRWLLPRGGKDRWSRRYLALGLRERLDRLRFHLDRRLRPDRPIAPFAWRHAYVRELCYRAADRYRPSPYAGRTVIFRNEQSAPAELFTTRADLGWGELLSGHVERLVIPGVHGQEFSAPGLDVLARELRRRL
ncbi:MAG TPA: alpha/beta fold hydrolase, partial [Planctomycetota bacterium]|nr:alpha/beta fold hydrolase [Planctomycetota bacterium]